MPRSSARLCNQCRRVVTGPCPNCGTSGWTERPARKRETPTSHRRWRNIRAGILATEPICRACGIQLATEVDHIVPLAHGGDELDTDNLQPICTACHKAKTQSESHTG